MQTLLVYLGYVLSDCLPCWCCFCCLPCHVDGRRGQCRHWRPRCLGSLVSFFQVLHQMMDFLVGLLDYISSFLAVVAMGGHHDVWIFRKTFWTWLLLNTMPVVTVLVTLSSSRALMGHALWRVSFKYPKYYGILPVIGHMTYNFI